MSSAVSATETRVKTSVQDADELSGLGFGLSRSRGINVSPMETGDFAYLRGGLDGVSSGMYFMLDKESLLPPNGTTILLTDNARCVFPSSPVRGRWLAGLPIGSPIARSVHLEEDSETSDILPVMLLHTDLDVRPGDGLSIVFTCSGKIEVLEPIAPNEEVALFFILRVNGILINGTGFSYMNPSSPATGPLMSVSLSRVVGPGVLFPGSNTVDVLWNASLLNLKGIILAASRPLSEHATLTLQPVMLQ